MFMRVTYNSLFLIILDFTIIIALTIFNQVFYSVDKNGVAMHSCNKKLKLHFHRSKLGMQSLSHVGPSAWNKLPNNLKTATSINCFKHNIKKYFLKVCVHYIFASLYCISKREHSWNKEKCFLCSFCSWDNQILIFQIFKCHDVRPFLIFKESSVKRNLRRPACWFGLIFIVLLLNM